MKQKRIFQRMMAMILTICLTLGIVQPVFAAETREAGDSAVMRMYNRENAGYAFDDSFPAPFAGKTSTDGGTKWAEMRLMNGGQPYSAYCIQIGVSVHTGDRYTAQSNYDDLPAETRLMINYVLMFGFDFGKTGIENPSYYFATQALIWQIEYGTVNTEWERKINDVFFDTIPEAQNYYNELKDKVYSYKTVPSFCGTIALNAPTHELSYDSTNGGYSTTLTDTNNVLQDFNFSYDGITFSPSGNVLSIHTNSNLSEPVMIQAQKNVPNDSRACVVDYWIGPEGVQHVVTANYNRGADPVIATMQLKISSGNLEIIKQSEDGIVSGIDFQIVGNGIDQTVTTGEDGTILVENLPSGEYTVTEITPDKYVEPESQKITVYGGQTATVTCSNILKKFCVELQKQDSAHNIPQRSDSNYSAQGDASLDGAVYGIYKDGNLLDTYTTSGGGQFVTKYYPCGDDYYIQEITPSEGYLLDPISYPVGAEPEKYTLENNGIPMTVKEDVILGQIAIAKHIDGSSGQMDTPEEGAQFQIYLKSAGSYEAAKSTERNLLITDEYGYAVSTVLPYGVYTVHQISGLEGHAFVPDFDVLINEEGKVYSFILSNPVYKSQIEIVKKDAETGKIIPLFGTGFKIKDMSAGGYITQHVNYPTPMDIDTFYTDNTGKLMLPEPLTYGQYQLHEVQAPEGYLLNSEPVDFSVDGTQDIITIEMKDIPVKGKITIEKTGEFLTGSSSIESEYGDVYQPIYETGYLAGAVFDIIAKTDIITPDGTVRAKAGDVVDTVTTTDSGVATSKELYLGEYIVKEKQAPEGMVLDTTEYPVTLTYGGQTVPVVTTSLELVNERQKVEVKLIKSLEQDALFDIGMKDEYKQVKFGLFAGEDILAVDSSVAFPKDCLIEIAGIHQDGSLSFQTDLPFGTYYVKERSTDHHYILNDTEYEFTFSYQDQEIPTVEIILNEGNPMENKLIRGNLEGWKVDEDGFGLQGATIGLFSSQTPEEPILTAVSNEIGYFAFTNIPYGEYFIKEIESPEGFVLSDQIYPVSIGIDQQIVEITVENQLIRGAVEVTKVDEEYPDHKLEEAEFEVVVDIDRNGEYNPEIDTQIAGTLQEVETGVYRLSELPYGWYFLHETKAPEGFLQDEGYYPFTVTTDGETVMVENQAGSGCFLNQPIKGEVEITKTDINTGKPLPNTGIEILDEDGNVVVQGRTDENGVFRFPLRYGKYYYREFDAPDGYLIDENKYPFEIKENGEVVKCQMTNQLKTGTVEFENPDNVPNDNNQIHHTPSTGDYSYLMIYLFIMLFIGAAIFISFGYRKKKRGK